MAENDILKAKELYKEASKIIFYDVNKDYDKAYKLIQESIELGYWISYELLGFLNNKGILKNSSKENAFKYLRDNDYRMSLTKKAREFLGLI